MIFRTNFSTLNIGLMMYGRARWQEAEATRKYFNIVQIHQDKRFLIFEFFKVLQGAIPLTFTTGQCIQLAQRKGLKFHQTRSNAFILYDTLPAYCISKAIVMKSEEIKNQKVYVSPRPLTCNLDSDVARSSKDINESN